MAMVIVMLVCIYDIYIQYIHTYINIHIYIHIFIYILYCSYIIDPHVLECYVGVIINYTQTFKQTFNKILHMCLGIHLWVAC